MPRISELPLEDAGIEDLMSAAEEVIRVGPLIDGKRIVEIELTGTVGDRQAFLEAYQKGITKEGSNILGVEGPIPIENKRYLYKLEVKKL